MALTDNLVSYYKLDESSGNASDSVGSNTLTNTGTVTYVAGKINNSASQTASSYLSKATNYGITGGNITIAGWVQPGSYVSGNNCFFGQTDSGTFTSYYIERSGSSTVLFYREKGGVGPQGYSATYTFSASTWYHVALTYDGTNVNAYINGVNVGSGAASGSGSSSMTNSGVSLNGRYYNSSTPINTTTELVDEVGIWNRALSADEVSTLYNSGTGRQYPWTGDAYTLAITVGTFALTGITTLFTKAMIMATTVRTYALTGVAATFRLGKGMIAGVGAFILTGINAILNPSAQWTAQNKSSDPTWTAQSKNSSTWTSQNKS